ncbi:MAG: hypothetical protein JNM88_01345 [Chitinophagaceae bacterium]|nr:hypothetical protein [Chitinophagaceae bacterium]
MKELLGALSAILKPKLIGLSIEERQVLAKMNDKTHPFCLKVERYCELNPEFTPNFMDVNEFVKDLHLVNELKPVFDIVSQMNSDLEDTTMLAGSEAYDAARYYYHSVKYAAKHGNAAAKPIYDDLAKRFPGPRGGKGGSDQPPGNTQ